jgi:hypothetical protein
MEHYFMPITADYIISINDREGCEARSGRDGSVVATGNEVASVIQRAIDRLPDEGGRIYLAAGCYWLEETIYLRDKNGVHLEGAARGITFSGGEEGTVLRSKKAIDLLDIHGDTRKVTGVTVSHLHLIGSGKDNGKAGIRVRGGSDLLSIRNVGANFCGTGFHFEGGHSSGTPGVIDAAQVQFCDPQVNGVGMLVERCHYAKIIGCEFSDCDTYGLVITSPDAGQARTQGVKVNTVTAVRNGKAGVLIGPNTDDTTITGGSDFGGNKEGGGIVVSSQGGNAGPRNVIIGDVHVYNNHQAGILIDGGSHVIVHGCICSVHDHEVVEDAGQQYGIYIKENSQDVLVNGNITYGNSERGICNETRKAVIANNSDSSNADVSGS